MASSSGRQPASWMLLALVLLLAQACAPKKPVYIPSEWQAPPSVQQPSPKPTESPVPTSKQTAILKPSPMIKESDITTVSEEPTQVSERKPSQTAEPKPPSQVSEKKPSQPAEKKSSQPPPQHTASMHLVNQAKASLAQGKADPAIPLLEQAIQVDVHNGEAFFNLAKAWRMKGSRQKALQFAQKAEVLYQNDPAKLKQVYLLEADLHKEMGNATKSDAYRQKASKLK